MSDRPRIAIVGCGIISELLLEGAALAGVDIGAVCDSDEQRAHNAAHRFGARVFTDYEAMLSDSQIDAVIVALPNFMHYDAAVLALNAGKHVFCEKPMTTYSDQSRDLVRLAETSGKVFQVGYMKRFNPAFAAGKESLSSIGPVTSASFRLTVNGNPILEGEGTEAQSWHGDLNKSGGGFLVHSGSHLLDLIMFYFGPPQSVFGSLSRDVHGNEYMNNYLFTMPGGVLVTLQMCITRAQGFSYAGGIWEEKVEVNGINGRFFAEDADWKGTVPARAFLHLADGEGPKALFTYWESQWAEELKAFEEGISRGECLGSSAVDGFRVDYILSELKKLEDNPQLIEFDYGI